MDILKFIIEVSALRASNIVRGDDRF